MRLCKYCYALVAYVPAKSSRDEGKEQAFWAALVMAVKQVPKPKHLFVLMDANALIGWRGGGKPRSIHCGVLGEVVIVSVY